MALSIITPMFYVAKQQLQGYQHDAHRGYFP